jgi:hypothetical protein
MLPLISFETGGRAHKLNFCEALKYLHPRSSAARQGSWACSVVAFSKETRSRLLLTGGANGDCTEIDRT